MGKGMGGEDEWGYRKENRLFARKQVRTDNFFKKMGGNVGEN